MTPRLGILRGQLVAQVRDVDALQAVERLYGHQLAWVPGEAPPPPVQVVQFTLADLVKMMGQPPLTMPRSSTAPRESLQTSAPALAPPSPCLGSRSVRTPATPRTSPPASTRATTAVRSGRHW